VSVEGGNAIVRGRSNLHQTEAPPQSPVMSGSSEPSRGGKLLVAVMKPLVPPKMSALANMSLGVLSWSLMHVKHN